MTDPATDRVAAAVPAAEGTPMPPAFPESAAGHEDRLLQGLAVDLRRERLEQPVMQRELERLRLELAGARQALERLQAALAQARRAARSDTLTGLPNRRGFEGPSRRVLAAHGNGSLPLALLFIDLDGFKSVNDSLGHEAGDALLRIVGARLAHAVREGDLVCRHGGDEFLCLLPHLGDAACAAAIATALLAVIAAPCQLGPHRVSVKASIGLALLPGAGRTVGALVRAADAAMYAAKSQGSGLAIARGPCASARSDTVSGPTV